MPCRCREALPSMPSGPDLIGEAFLFRHLTGDYRSAEEQGAIVLRALARAGKPVVTTVVHAAQDLAEGSATHPTVLWLDRLVSEARDVSSLAAIANELPENTLALRERAAEIGTRLVELLFADVAAHLSQLPALTTALNNLSLRLSALGQHEAALAVSEEAVALRRDLTAARPDAFLPDLAIMLWVMADRLDETRDPAASVGTNREAIATLAPFFHQLPNAFEDQMTGMVREYLERCEKSGITPDEDLLTPILAVLVSRHPPQEKEL
jgi:hypothetical protein